AKTLRAPGHASSSNGTDPAPHSAVAADADAMETEPDSDDDDEWERVVPGPAATTVLLSSQPAVGSSVGEWFVERSKFIPLRL
ncbi:unnamed protein product, partial [Mycena citricolor]